MDNTRKIMASRLKEARLSAGLTQEEVRIKLGYKSISTVSSHESGDKAPRPEELFLLSKIYKVTIDWLMGSSNDPHTTRAVYLTHDELEFLDYYRKASHVQKEIVKDILTSDVDSTPFLRRANGM